MADYMDGFGFMYRLKKGVSVFFRTLFWLVRGFYNQFIRHFSSWGLKVSVAGHQLYLRWWWPLPWSWLGYICLNLSWFIWNSGQSRLLCLLLLISSYSELFRSPHRVFLCRVSLFERSQAICHVPGHRLSDWWLQERAHLLHIVIVDGRMRVLRLFKALDRSIFVPRGLAARLLILVIQGVVELAGRTFWHGQAGNRWTLPVFELLINEPVPLFQKCASGHRLAMRLCHPVEWAIQALHEIFRRQCSCWVFKSL